MRKVCVLRVILWVCRVSVSVIGCLGVVVDVAWAVCVWAGVRMVVWVARWYTCACVVHAAVGVVWG